MFSNINYNLSFANEIPTTTEHCENLVTAVSKTLNKFCAEELYQDYLDLYNFQKSVFFLKECRVKIQPEKGILCEINAGLWVKAITSAIHNLSNKTCPHYTITQNIIRYLLNASSEADFGLLEEYFCKLILTFPPGPQSFDYYWPIVSEPLFATNTKMAGNSGLFFWLIDNLTACLNNQKILDIDSMRRPGSTCVKKNKPVPLYSEEKILEVIDNFNGINLNQSLVMKRQKENLHAFFELSWDRKTKNILVALNFLYDILEGDFSFWLTSKNFPEGKRPFLSCLLWENERAIGLNTEIQKIINLYKIILQSPSHKSQKLFVVKKLVSLLAEVMRCKDMTEGMKYPFFGIHSNSIARQISQVFLAHLEALRSKNEFPKDNYLFLNLKPAWLRLLVCSHLLSALTGYQCLPELTGVYDILENIAHTEACFKSTFKKPKITRIPKNSKLVKELKNYKSINSKLKNGKTLLHMACEENNVEKVQALLTFPELDVNSMDREGWTALHFAACKGNSSCVQELLAFNPKSDVQKPVNTRALGPKGVTPLMCAVSAGNVEVCRLLLEHTGSVLLEDFNELNQTPLELSQKPGVMKILKHYKDNYLRTWYSQKDINFDLDFKEIIIKLCVEMVQAYFSTHRTWDVYRTLKKPKNSDRVSLEPVSFKNKFQWDYLRYQRDIKRNIYKLRRLVPQLANVPEFRSSNQIYTRLLTFNET